MSATETSEAHGTDTRVVPPSIRFVADAVEATAGSRLRRAAWRTHQKFVADAAHVEFLPQRKRRYAAAWKIVSHCGVVLRADVHTDDDGMTVVGRVDGRVVGVASSHDEVIALIKGIGSALDQVAICA